MSYICLVSQTYHTMKRKLLFLLLICTTSLSYGQMWNGVDSLYGNEWINYDQSYYKIPVAEDGIYRLSYVQLQQAGLPLSEIQGQQFQLFHLGEEQPIYTTSSGVFSSGDYIEFWGEKNRDEVDQFLFADPDSTLNPWYSLVTDTSAYFLTWTDMGAPNLRYETITNDLSNLPSPESWYWADEIVFFSDIHRKEYVSRGGGFLYHSYYGGEGFAKSNDFYLSKDTFTISCPDAYLLNINGSLDLRFITNDPMEGHAMQIHLNDELVATENFFGAKYKQFDFSIDTDLLAENSLLITVEGTNTDEKYSIAGGHLRYPKMFSPINKRLWQGTLPDLTGDRYLELDSLLGSDPAILYDISNQMRLVPLVDGGKWKVKLPAATGDRNLVVSKMINPVSDLQPVTFIDYSDVDAQYLIITNKRLRDDGEGNDWVQAYADYRTSAEGGAHKVSIVEIQQLYEQFAYGIERHPLSIRNFVHYAYGKWDDLNYCFLIGKGRDYVGTRTSEQLSVAMNEGAFQLPAFGWPASDNLLLGSHSSTVPIVPVGRLAVINGEEIRGYLDKVQAMEAQVNVPYDAENRAWMKKVLHLGGGNNGTERTNIQINLNNMASEIESNSHGGEVTSFYRRSTDPIETSTSDLIFKVINNGVSIITFMGHSSPGTFDFNIDNPENFFNEDRYPLMLSLGCYSGNIFLNGRSIGERFTLLEKKAAVAYGASLGVGFPDILGSFSRTFYSKLGRANYGQGIGDALRSTIATHEYSFDVSMTTLAQQFVLHGDPAIRLYPAEGPDYVFDPSTVSFDPPIVTANMDSVTVNLEVLNIGKNEQDTFALALLRIFPDAVSTSITLDNVIVDRSRTRLSYTIPTEGRLGVGNNLFRGFLDINGEVSEWPTEDGENNNELKRTNGELGIPLFILDNSAQPVYPSEFSIINKAGITLKASTTLTLAPEQLYLIELDTTGRFDSPVKQMTEKTQGGGVIEWTPNINWQDSTVYHWRISPDSTGTGLGYVWIESSFTYIEEGAAGWRQSDYWQLKQNKPSQIGFTDSSEVASFSTVLLDMRVRNKIWDSSDRPGFFYDNDGHAGSVRPWLYLNQGVSVMVFEPNTGVNWRNSGQQYGSVDANNKGNFSYDTRFEEQRFALYDLLTNIVPEDYYIFLFTVQAIESADYSPELWAADSLTYGANLFSILEDQGGVLARQLEDVGSIPYAIMYQKGGELLDEGIAAALLEETNVNCIIPRQFTEGDITTKLIGPASSWDKLEFNWSSQNNSVDDTLKLSLIAVQPNGIEATILPDISANTDLSGLSADFFPYIRLKQTAKDINERSLVVPEYWQVTYEPLPELAINPATSTFSFHADTLQEGEKLRISFDVENLNGVPADSTWLTINVQDDQNNEIIKDSIRLAPFPSEGRQSVAYDTTTIGMSGTNQLNILLNPEQRPLEPYYFNNYLFAPFEVTRDKINPLLNVAFDGRFIMDGDLVSPQPEIAIRLKDENPYLPLNDTSLVKIWITDPSFQEERVYFSQLHYNLPTEQSRNNLEIVYRPEFEEDGDYLLRVEARDITGNLSGNLNYEVNFKVLTQNSISNLLNYPNPFSTSTQFVYTLTGEPPTYFSIQIMTTSGRVVRQITQDEIGPLEVGTHRTDYAWDGRDDYGDLLANGVYLYRIMAKDAFGKSFENYGEYSGDNRLSRYFKNGFGKMVILR
jgi:hypothetical protein